MLPAIHHLDWPNCYNARDLGGLPTVDEYQTQRGFVVRADTTARLTEVGRQALLDYGIRTIIDLRAPQEVVKYPTFYSLPGYEDDAPTYRIVMS